MVRKMKHSYLSIQYLMLNSLFFRIHGDDDGIEDDRCLSKYYFTYDQFCWYNYLFYALFLSVFSCFNCYSKLVPSNIDDICFGKSLAIIYKVVFHCFTFIRHLIEFMYWIVYWVSLKIKQRIGLQGQCRSPPWPWRI